MMRSTTTGLFSKCVSETNSKQIQKVPAFYRQRHLRTCGQQPVVRSDHADWLADHRTCRTKGLQHHGSGFRSWIRLHQMENDGVEFCAPVFGPQKRRPVKASIFHPVLPARPLLEREGERDHCVAPSIAATLAWLTKKMRLVLSKGPGVMNRPPQLLRFA